MDVESSVVLSSFNDFKTLDKHVANDWQRFQRGEGVLHSRSVILSSWQRSKRNEVNPRKRLADVIYYDDSLREQQEESEALLEIARPHIEKLFAKIAHENMVITLSNHKGIIISEKSSKAMWNKVEGHHFLSGADWSEEGVGTNAIGTALIEEKPVQIFSGEHFCEGWHPWVCSSSPIKDPITNQTLGVLNITGEKHLLQAHNIDLVINHARQIEHNIGFRLMRDQLSPLYSLFNSFRDPILIYNLDGEIKQFNKAAKHMLNVSRGMNVFNISKLKDYQNYNKFDDINGIEINDKLWDIKLYSYKYGERVLGSMAVFKKRRNKTLSTRNGKLRYNFNDIVTKNKEMLQLINQAKKAAYSDLNTVVYGETGTGKELLVQSIHQYGRRQEEPFVAINCGAIPQDLIASELFGYEAGAFTGARAKGKKGKFQLADKGTIFLDEISELSLEMQQYLLRVLEEREVVPIGGGEPIPIDVRVICATNKNLQEEVEKGNFREDLYYRLHVINLTLPSLRERKDDISYLVNYFLSEANRDMNIDGEALNILENYEWPGNIRQLKNCIDQALFHVDGNTITVDVLPDEIINNSELKRPQRDQVITKELLLSTLDETKGNITKAAKKLNVSRMTIYRRKKAFQIE